MAWEQCALIKVEFRPDQNSDGIDQQLRIFL